MKNWFKISKIRQKKLLSIFGGKNDWKWQTFWLELSCCRPGKQQADQPEIRPETDTATGPIPTAHLKAKSRRQTKNRRKMAISWKSTQLHRATCTYFAILQRENRPLATRANRKWRQKWCKSDNKGGEELMNWKRKKETASQIFYEAFRFTQFTCIGVYCLARDCRKGEGREKEREKQKINAQLGGRGWKNE